MNRPFRDRQDAGRQLARRLRALRLAPPLLVLALPRGGVPVAAEVARALEAPLDLLLVRKIGAPWHKELALAAVVEGDPPQLVIDEEVQRYAGADERYLQTEQALAVAEIARRREAYLRGRCHAEVRGATVIVVDDGIATGTTMRAALLGLRRRGARQLVLAVPVAPAETLQRLAAEVDEVVCLQTPSPFHAVGAHYVDFAQLEDHEVIATLDAVSAPARPT